MRRASARRVLKFSRMYMTPHVNRRTPAKHVARAILGHVHVLTALTDVSRDDDEL